ncbi:hypothetical protein HJ01_01177 [Flavobacterium frigoris PS1]|uniref:Uncharacterized protein n=1 Tax=Flavobacterium frigoris (strain PS1) TaxID=1086011 RepID=H7FPR7_FLAFP|nr:hypothetical protein HJ01_01177 [Flavobacterium frigoris PS1]
MIYLFIGVTLLFNNLKNITMKKLFEKFYDYLSNFLFGGEKINHY